MPKSVLPVLLAILDAIEGIEDATGGKTIADYRSNWLLRHGVQRALEIISEASRRIPAEIQATQPHILWAEIAGMGNILRHEYHRISDKLIWSVVEDGLSPLKTAIISIKTGLEDG